MRRRSLLVLSLLLLLGGSLAAQTYVFSKDGVPLITGPLEDVKAFVADYEEPTEPPPDPPCSSHAHTGALPHNIPNVTTDPSRPLVIARHSGNWNDPEVWSTGQIPNAQTVFKIDPCVVVTITDTTATAFAGGVDGALVHSPNVPTWLTVGTLQIYEGGAHQVGTAVTPIAATTTAGVGIASVPIDTTNDGFGVFDPEQWGTGYQCFGVCVWHGRVLSQTHTKLSIDPVAGATTLTVPDAAAIADWRAGHEVVIPDTRQIPFTDAFQVSGPLQGATQDETRTIASINGAVITLTSPLQFSHVGYKNGMVTEHFAHVGNLSRNVILRSEGAIRGHAVFTHRATVDMKYVRVQDIGRTTGAPLNDTVIDAQTGNVVHVGTNQKGRYFHLHHLMGPVNSSNVGYQFMLVGLAVVNPLKWGITVHNAHYGLVAKNVVYNAQGGGIVTEEGNESFNVFEQNFVVKVRSLRINPGNGGIDAPSRYDIWFEGSCYSFSGPHNYVRDNVAASCAYYGYNYNGYYLLGVNTPKFRGADTTKPGEFIRYNHEGVAGPDLLKVSIPQLEFARNAVMGNSFGGLWGSWHGGCCGVESYTTENLFTDFLGVHLTANGVEFFHESHNTFAGFVLKNNPAATDLNQGGDRTNRGFRVSHYAYENGWMVIRNAHVTGSDIGIELPPRPASALGHDYTHVLDSTLKNHVNISEMLPGIPKDTLIKNVVFQPLVLGSPAGGLPATQTDIWMNPDTFNKNKALSSTTRVEDFNGVASDDFHVFSLLLGVNPPATCSTTRPQIIGYVCPN